MEIDDADKAELHMTYLRIKGIISERDVSIIRKKIAARVVPHNKQQTRKDNQCTP